MSDRALLLAVALINRHGVESFEGDAANELRRLHEENERIRSVCAATSEGWRADAEEWKAQRDELLEALRGIAMHTRRSTIDPADIVPTAGAIFARAAIKKAEGTE